VHHQWLPDRLNAESGIAAQVGAALKQRGHTLREQTSLGVVQAIRKEAAKVSGAADPRKVARAKTE
jgi:gamma-glutamyltranspeptidase/glutathione hydrolase